MKPILPLKIVVAACALAPVLSFGAVYTESVNGELSGAPLHPTVFTLTSGANTLTGAVVSGDVDYVTFNIPAGFEFQSFTLDSYTGSAGTLTKSFIAIQRGTTFTEPTTGTNVANLLGYTHFGPTGAQGEILDDMGTGAGSMGFVPPLLAGNYTFWIQETGSQSRNYSFTLTMSPVPEPSVAALFALGAGALIFRRRRKRA